MPPVKVRCPECETILRVQVEGPVTVTCPKCKAKVPVRSKADRPATEAKPAPAAAQRKGAAGASAASPPPPSPKKKKKKRAASSGNTARNLVIGGVVGVVVGLAIFFALRPRQGSILSPSVGLNLANAKAADFLPADGDVIVRCRVDKLLQGIKQIPGVKEQLDKQLAAVGGGEEILSLDEVYAVNKGDTRYSAIVFKQPIESGDEFVKGFLNGMAGRQFGMSPTTAQMISRSSLASEETYKGVTIHVTRGLNGLSYTVVANPQLILHCNSRTELVNAMERMSKGEKTGFQYDKDAALSMKVKEVASLLPSNPAVAASTAQSENQQDEPKPENEWVKSVQSAELQLDLTGEGLVGQAVAQAKDQAAADELNTIVSQQLTKMQAMLSIAQMMAPKPAGQPASQSQDSAQTPLKLSQNESTLTLDIHLPTTLLASLTSSLGGMVGSMPGRGGPSPGQPMPGQPIPGQPMPGQPASGPGFPSPVFPPANP